MTGSIAISVTADGEITVEPKNPVIMVSAPTAAVTVQSGGVPGPPGPEGEQGPPGGAYLSARWNFNQNTAAPPASGTLRMNATTYAAATVLWISEEDRDNLDRQAGLDQIAIDNQIIMQSPQGRAVWNVTSVVDAGTYRTVGVTLAESTGARPSGGAATTLYINSSGGGGGGSGATEVYASATPPAASGVAVLWVDTDGTVSEGGALDDLTDVDAASPADGDALLWDETAGAWVPGEVLPTITVSATAPPTPAENDIWIDLGDSPSSGASAITVSATAPPAPAENDIWIDLGDSPSSGASAITVSATAPPAPAENDIWIDLGDSPSSGASALDDLTDVDAASPADGDALLWDETAGAWVPRQAVGPAGPVGPPGTAYLSAQWNFNQNTAAPPASGTLRMNATTYAAATTLWVSETDRDGLGRSLGLDLATAGDQIIMQSAQGRVLWDITGQADSGTYRTFTVVPAEVSGTRPSAGSPTTLYFASTGEGGGGYTRATATKTTASLAAGASESSTITMAAGYRLYRITTSAPCRVRLYTTTAKRDADVARLIGTDPTGDHGLMLEFVSISGLLTADLSPLVDGFDGKTTPDGLIPITVTNTGTGSTAITVDLLYLRTE